MAAAQPAAIILLRHAEKPADPEAVHLSREGEERAKKLVAFLTTDPVLIRHGLPAALYAARPTKHGHGVRTRETLAPLAKQLHMAIQTPYLAEEYSALAKSILGNPQYRGRTVVICWIHEFLPQFAGSLGVSPEPPKWKGDVFDRLYLISYEDGKANLQDLPQKFSPDVPKHKHHSKSPPLGDADGQFHWNCSESLLSAADRPEDPCYSVKDPSIVYYQNRWHLFSTIRSEKRSHQIEYVSFADWPEAAKAPRHILTLTNGYFCAPEVFYFAPHRKWYLIYQIAHGPRKMLQPAYSTSTSIADPTAWSSPIPLYPDLPENIKAWIDFWVICDAKKAYLFFTSNNGLMWWDPLESTCRHASLSIL